jgi:hypothetical protein
MAYTAVTEVPDLNIFQWATPGKPRPRLAAPISDTITTLTFTAPPLDKDSVVITGNFLMGIQNTSGYTETVYVPAGKMSADGLTASDVIRGIRLEGLDYTTSGTGLAVAAGNDAEVFCNVAPFIGKVLIEAAIGGVGTTTELAERLQYSSNGVLTARHFANAAARDATYTSPVIGDLCFLEDTEDLQIYLTAGWTDLDTAVASSAKTAAIANASSSVGELYRSTDDANSLYYNNNGSYVKVIDFTTGLIDTGSLPIASQAEAEAGTNNTNVMTPLRVEQHEASIYTAKGDSVWGTGSKTRAILSAGADGTVLTFDSSEATGLKASSSFAAKGQINYSTVLIQNTTVETALFSLTLPGGTLGTNNAVRFKIHLKALATSSSNSTTFRMKYGSTTVCSISHDSTDPEAGVLEGLLLASGATGTQNGLLILDLAYNTNTFDSYKQNEGTATEDSTGDLTFTVTAQHQVATTGDKVTAINSVVEYIR